MLEYLLNAEWCGYSFYKLRQASGKRMVIKLTAFGETTHEEYVLEQGLATRLGVSRNLAGNDVILMSVRVPLRHKALAVTSDAYHPTFLLVTGEQVQQIGDYFVIVGISDPLPFEAFVVTKD